MFSAIDQKKLLKSVTDILWFVVLVILLFFKINYFPGITNFIVGVLYEIDAYFSFGLNNIDLN